MKLSDKILELRKEHNLSQEALAEKLDVSRQAVSRWEAGASLPDASNILQLSKLFNVTADYLLNDDCEIKSDNEKPQHSIFTKKLIGWCTFSVGCLANFTFYILSRFIKAPGWVKYYNLQEEEYRYRAAEVYDYKAFIEHHNLELLTVLFWLFIIGGLIIVFVKKEHIKKLLDFAKNKFTAIKNRKKTEEN